MITLLLLLASPSEAASPYLNVQGGVYGVSAQNPVAGRCLFGDPADGCFPVMPTVAGRLGLQLDDNWSMEATVGWAQGNTLKMGYGFSEWFPELNARYIFNPYSKVNVFGTVGAGITHTTVNRPSRADQSNDAGFGLYRNPSVDGMITVGPGLDFHLAGPVYLRTDLDLLLTLGSDPTPDRTDVWGTWRFLIGPEFRKAPVKETAPEPVSDECKDEDDDGVCLANDKCPTEREDKDGFQDGDGCIDPDNDGDTLLDRDDSCPNEPEDVDGFKDNDGCPDPDNDQDKIPDTKDKCPNDPENMNGYEDLDGCPEEVPQQVQKFTGVIEGVYFDFDKDTILPASNKKLTEALAVLNQFPDLKLEVQGHTDAKGDDAYNMDLSQRRAEAVVKWFTEHGLSADRFRAVGYGETRPIDTNETDAGRAKNRRVEFHPYSE